MEKKEWYNEEKTPWEILIEFPAEIRLKSGRRGYFSLTNEDDLGWLATYQFYELDILDLTYSESAEEAIRKLSAKLKDEEIW